MKTAIQGSDPLEGARGFTLIEIMIVVAIIGLIVALALPNFLKSRTRAQTHICIENLSQIESAKQVWGLENGKQDGDTVAETDIIGPTLYIKTVPICPAGGVYDLTTIGNPASCNITGHSL
jgi:prepilin-type N-terminal cleavage/methylation domain-containing protein